MLQTQVAYWQLQEGIRHNKATEKQSVNELKQTISYQSSQVKYWKGQLAELSRHNRVTEKLSAKELKIKRMQATAALQQADAALQQALAALQNADTNAYNAETNRLRAQVDAGKAVTYATEVGSKVALNRATAAKAKADAALNKEKKKIAIKEGKTYYWTKVVLPSVKTLSGAYNDVSSGTGKFLSGAGSFLFKAAKGVK